MSNRLFLFFGAGAALFVASDKLRAAVPGAAKRSHAPAPASRDVASRLLPHKYARPLKKPLNASRDESYAVKAAPASSGPEMAVPKSLFARALPGSSAYKALGQLPGIDFSSTDPLGVDGYGSAMYMRGFFLNQIGVTLDGVPLNDQTYQSVSGMSLNSSVITEDIGQAVVSQGGGDVSQAGTNTLGGTMRFSVSDPRDRPGGKITQTFGSYGSYRTFARLDSGILNHTGTKFYGAYARTSAGMWEGRGNQFLQQVDGRLVQPAGPKGKLSAFFNWTDLEQQNYPDMSLGMIKNLGWRVPHLYPDYGEATKIAAACQSGQQMNVPGYGPTNSGSAALDACSTALYDGGQNERNYHGGLNFDYYLTSHLQWKNGFYGHAQQGYYTYTDYSTATPPWTAADPSAGSPMSLEAWQNWQRRFGFQSSLHYKRFSQNIALGVWYEHNSQHASLQWYPEPTSGAGSPVKAVGPYNKYGSAFQKGYAFGWRTNIVQPYIQDRWRLMRGLYVTAGFKAASAVTSGGAFYNNSGYTGAGQLPNGRLSATKPFLPHFNVDYRFLRHHELYADAAENMRAYEVSGFGVGNSLYSVQNQKIFEVEKRRARPSTAWTFMGGYRYSIPVLQVNATVYHSAIRDQLSSATVGTLNNPQSSIVNFKRMSLTGVTGMATLTPLPGLSFMNSISYNKGRYGRNVNVLSTDDSGKMVNAYYPLKNKNIVNYPAWMYKTSVSYAWRGATAHFDANYYSRRYYSFMNDTHVPSYWVANTGIDYKIKKLPAVPDVLVSFNVYNLFNNKYIAAMGTENNPVRGDYQSLERGSVRQFFGNLSMSF